MRSSLQQFVVEILAARDRGLPVTAEDVCAGLQYAMSEKAMRDDNGAVRFEVGAEHAIYRARAFVTRLEAEPLSPAVKDALEIFNEGLAARRKAEEDRRFGQPHYGHHDQEE